MTEVEYAASLNGVTGSGSRTSTANGPIVAESRCIVCSDVLDVFWGLVLVVGLTIDSQVAHERPWLTPTIKLLLYIKCTYSIHHLH